MASTYPRKYHFNEKFFLKWSPEMAYILGFWFADGYMTSDKSYRVAFFSKDKSLLENIANTLSYDAPLKRFNRNGKPDSIYTLLFRSKNLITQMQSLGGVSRKSLVMQFPEIPTSFLADFIRGYFDGDGSVHLTRYLRTKDHRQQVELRSSFVSGSQQFLLKLRDILTKLVELTHKKVFGFNTEWRLEYGIKDTLKFLRFIYYPGCNLYLDRKFAIYQKYLQRQN